VPEASDKGITISEKVRKVKILKIGIREMLGLYTRKVIKVRLPYSNGFGRQGFN